MVKSLNSNSRGRRGGPLGLVLGAALTTAMVAATAAGALAAHGTIATATASEADQTAARGGDSRLVLNRRVATAPARASSSSPDTTASVAPAPASSDEPVPTPTPSALVVPSPEAAEARAATPTAAASPAATPAPAAVSDNGGVRGGGALSAGVPALEREHKVAAGETLSLIAQRYSLATDTLVINNVSAAGGDLLKVGQSLRIPPHDGLLYEIRMGESIATIAKRYGIDPKAVVSEPANRLNSVDMIREGQVLLLPGAKPAAAPTPAPAPAPIGTFAPPLASRTATSASVVAAAPVRSAVAFPAPTAATRPVLPAAIATATVRPAAAATSVASFANAGGWVWPITGALSSYFNPGHPLGIDVDLYGRDGAPIVAARGGTVTFAGGNPCCSYGYYVELDHGDGFHTTYAHFNAPPPVRIGQQVAQGQVVGYGGSTGYSTGTHLHFEIRKGGVPVNPLAYLP